MIASRKDPGPNTLHAGATERRRAERFDGDTPGWIGQRVGTTDEVARLKEMLAFSARQMGQLRSRNEQLMAVNSDLRCKLGEMTLRWVDACTRLAR